MFTRLTPNCPTKLGIILSVLKIFNLVEIFVIVTKICSEIIVAKLNQQAGR